MAVAEKVVEGQSPHTEPKPTSKAIRLFENAAPPEGGRRQVVTQLAAYYLTLGGDPTLPLKDLIGKVKDSLEIVPQIASGQGPTTDPRFVLAAGNALEGKVEVAEAALEGENGSMVRLIKAMAGLNKVNDEDLKTFASNKYSPLVNPPLMLIALDLFEREKSQIQVLTEPVRLEERQGKKAVQKREARAEPLRKRVDATDELRDRAKALRTRLGLSQSYILGKNRQPTYSAMERGTHHQVSRKMLTEIAEKFGVPLEELLEGGPSVDAILQGPIMSVAIAPPKPRVFLFQPERTEPKTPQFTVHPRRTGTIFTAPASSSDLSTNEQRGPKGNAIKKFGHDIDDAFRIMGEKMKGELSFYKGKDNKGKDIEITLIPGRKARVKSDGKEQIVDYSQILFFLPYEVATRSLRTALYKFGRSR